MPDTTAIDIAALAAPLNDMSPCGDNLEYDPRFLALEEAVDGKPDVQYGTTITPATPPDWQAVQQLSLALMEHSRDLRLAVPLTRSLLALQGAGGLADGMSLLAELLARQWDQLHPQLDPSDDNDPTLRVNVLSDLRHLDGLLRAMPLAQVKALGSVSLRDIELAVSDAAPPAGQQKMTMAVIDAVFAAADQATLVATHAALAASAAGTVRIEQMLTERVGVGSALDLGPLAALLVRAADAIRSRLPAGALQPGDMPEQEGGQEGDREGERADAESGADDAATAAGRKAPQAGTIDSRADVVRTIDALCAWYARHEPASPVPLLLQRARTLVDKSFIELLQELAPDASGQLALVIVARNAV